MGKVTGFLEVGRVKHPVRPVVERLRDWREVYVPYPEAALTDQALIDLPEDAPETPAYEAWRRRVQACFSAERAAA